MIDKLRYATISQIYVKDLKFFDPNNIDASLRLCKKMGITYLPDINRQKCYELVGEEFIPKDLNQVKQCSPNDLIFSKKTLAKFDLDTSDNVLFVTESEKIKGVVHIVDYNNDFIFFEFYKVLFAYEKMLRKFLVLKNETNESFLEHISEKKNSEFWTGIYTKYTGGTDIEKAKKIKIRSALGPFQSFLLFELISFCNSKFFKIENQYALTSIRNRIAHFRDIIKRDKELKFRIRN